MKLSQNEINEIYKIIGKNVKKIRMEKGLSQLELSLELGYNTNSKIPKNFGIIRLWEY